MNLKTAVRASVWLAKRYRFNSSHSSVAKKGSHMVLSRQSPTEAIEGRTPDSGLAATRAERRRRVLAALVRVMDHVLGPAAPYRHAERLEDQFRAQVVRHRPSHDAPAEHVEHHRQVEEPRPGRDVRDIGEPKLVGSVSDEVPLHEIGRRPRVLVADRRSAALAPADAAQAGLAHQARDPLATNVCARFDEVFVDSRHAVSAVRD